MKLFAVTARMCAGLLALAAVCRGGPPPPEKHVTVVYLDVSGSMTDDARRTLDVAGVARAASGQFENQVVVRDWITQNQAVAKRWDLFAQMSLVAELEALDVGLVEVHPFTHVVQPAVTLDAATQQRLFEESLFQSPGTSITTAIEAGLARMDELMGQAHGAVRGRLVILTDGRPGSDEPNMADILKTYAGLRQANAKGAFEIEFLASTEAVRQGLKDYIGDLSTATVASPDTLLPALRPSAPVPAPEPMRGSSAGPVMVFTLILLIGGGAVVWLLINHKSPVSYFPIRVLVAREGEAPFAERTFGDDQIDLSMGEGVIGWAHWPVCEDAAIFRVRGGVVLDVAGTRRRLQPGERAEIGPGIYVSFEYVVEPEPDQDLAA